MSSEQSDPYIDPETGVLRNLVGAKTSADLARAEADLVAARIIQLRDHRLVMPSRDVNEILGLHRHLFQDLYSWAGSTRTVDIKRGDGDFFAPWQGILRNIDVVLEDLYAHDCLRGLEQDDFTTILTRFYDDLNFIHPFREGNGRAQRLFWSRVAFDAGWILDWSSVHGPELNEASRLAREDLKLAPLQQTLAKCIRPR